MRGNRKPKKTLPIHLLVFLGCGIPICLVLHYWLAKNWDLAGLLINICADLISVIFMVFYVERVMSRYKAEKEAEKWRPADSLIVDRLRTLSNAISRAIRQGLGVSADALQIKQSHTINLYSADRQVLEVNRVKIKPQIHENLVALDDKGWELLIGELKSVHNNTQYTIQVFLNHLFAEQIRLLLEIEESLRCCHVAYDAYKEILGKPELAEKFEKFPGQWKKQREMYIADTTQHLKKILNCLDKFSKVLDS